MSNRRIAILYKTTDGPWGGGNSFLRSLRHAWISQGIDVVDKLEDHLDGVLLNSSYRAYNRRLYPADVARMIRFGYEQRWPTWLGLSRWRRIGSRPPFVHRLDGVFRLYGRRPDDPADRDQVHINRHVDWTIYQSEFCRQSFANEAADVTRSTVIYNGVDTDRFFPALQPPPENSLRLIAVSWSPNIRKGFREFVAAASLPGVEVTFVGNWPHGLDAGQVKVIPPQPHDTLPELLRQHHALLHMAQNDPCSNAILEGLACGLPVVYHPSGGSPEIVGDCGVACKTSLQEAIDELRRHYSELRERTLDRRPDLSIKEVARKYLAVFEQVGRIAV